MMEGRLPLVIHLHVLNKLEVIDLPIAENTQSQFLSFKSSFEIQNPSDSLQMRRLPGTFGGDCSRIHTYRCPLLCTAVQTLYR